MFLQNQVNKIARWMGRGGAAPTNHCPRRDSFKYAQRKQPKRSDLRAHRLEVMEPRYLMAADVLQIGAVYIEEDLGSDLHGDMFHVTFHGGAEGTQLSQLVIDGDLGTPGFGLGDLFFDTKETGLGADHAFDFRIEKLQTARADASVTANVVDGSTRLVLNFTNFLAGDLLVFSIDVDEVQFYDPAETDLAIINDNFDPITSGVEFQNSLFEAHFVAPHYENVSGQSKFLNRYDPILTPTGLPLPADDFGGKRDRSTGAAISLQQVPKPISLAGIVYQDRNEDLVWQNGEQRLAGVQLELYRLEPSGYVSTGHRTTTDSQGHYRFGTELQLQPGTFQVRESQPTGYYSVGASVGKLGGTTPVGQLVPGNPDILTQVDLLLGDQHATELNFAENRPSSISGHVCVVLNGFDCFSATSEKAPLADVLVELRDASGTVVDSQRTNADGYYQFVGLRSGIYSVTEITPNGLLEGSARAGSVGGNLSGGSRIAQIALAGDTLATDYDFCELTPSDISGFTFFDQNNSGRRDPGETPLTNVLVTLWDADGKQVAQTRSDGLGHYRFDGLRPGNYRVTEQTPAGYIPGRSDVGTIRGKRVGRNDSTGDVIAEIALPAGSSGIHYDFGEILAGSIAGRVISDTNGNCVIDAVGEMPLAGVTIELLDAQGMVLRTTLTDGDGEYRFDDLLPATYSVREVQPVGYFHGDQMAGSGGGDDGVADLISMVQVGPGQALVDYDFCDIPPGSIAGLVFNDNDGDCVFDTGEQPISGVLMTLLDADGNTVATTRTDSQGRYEFVGLRPGQYTVRESQPVGYLQGGQRAGSGGGNDSVQDVISQISLGAGTQLVNYDFCEQLPGSIAGVVFTDLDFDCIQDADELPISGVQIDLLDTGGRVIATTTTAGDGSYEFVNLRPGNYTVREHQPDGYFHGGQKAPASGGNASLADIISNLNLMSGKAITQANFCEVPPAEISGYVFQDGPVIRNTTGEVPEDRRSVRDGLRTEDDTPIAGVTVQLRLVTGAQAPASIALPGYYSGEFIEVMTDANGFYSFQGLRAGAYNLFQLQPSDYIDSLDTPGSTGGLSLNSVAEIDSFFESSSNAGLRQFSNQQLLDAVIGLSLEPGQASLENNFSEVQAAPILPPPPPPPPPPPIERPNVEPPLYASQLPLVGKPLTWEPLPLIIGFGYSAPPTWHLSVINGGTPRGSQSGEPIDQATVAKNARRLNVETWTVRGMVTDGRWRVISTQPVDAEPQRKIFDLVGARPLAGDFNGDGKDEIALFVDGEWFIDINANGAWDESDIWLRLGSQGDQPVVGDWDNDGKTDVGIFGRRWQGDERAIAAEPGLPDPENTNRGKFKNVPPDIDEAPDDPRLLKRNRSATARADLIDHVFRFGGGMDTAVSGDFNGDGIATIGVFRDGRWLLDVNGDGKLTAADRREELGQPGDLPLVGDFDGDGVDELAVVRGNQVLVDSNGNGHFDATDQVFLLESSDGTVIAGDFDGDGFDEPVLHQSAQQLRSLQASRM